MSKFKVQIKSKAQSEKNIIFDFLFEEKDVLTFSHLNFI